MSKIKFEDLLGTGAHFGHVTRKWDPNFKPYILLEKNGFSIISLLADNKNSNKKPKLSPPVAIPILLNGKIPAEPNIFVFVIGA